MVMLSELPGVARKWLSDRVDLSETSDLLLALLDDSRAWKHRVVQELEFESGAYVRATTRIQGEFPPALTREFIGREGIRTANVMLPLGTQTKRPLLRFALEGAAGRPAHLLSRASSAALQAEYLERLRLSSPAADALEGRFADGLFEAICVFTPDLFRSYLEAVWDPAEPMEAALLEYLRGGFGELLQVELTDVRRWRAHRHEVGRILATHLEEDEVVVSSSEEVILALPRLDPLPATTHEIDRLIEAYNAGVRAADAAGDSPFLSTLAEYGRRYEVIVETEVPLGEPFTVRFAEDRPLELSPRRASRQRFALGEGRSSHLQVTVTDPAVALATVIPKRLDGTPVKLGAIESARLTTESAALYSSEPDRPFYIDLAIVLRPRLSTRWMYLILFLVNAAASWAAARLAHDAQPEARLAVLALPTTLAATLLLIREQSALAMLLLDRYRVALGMSVMTLWGIALWELLHH